MATIKECLEAQIRTFGTRTLYETICIALYELGAVSRNVIHAAAQVDPFIAKAQYADSLAELSDLITQADLLRLQILEKVSPSTQDIYRTLDLMAEMGRERQVERMEEWKVRRAE